MSPKWTQKGSRNCLKIGSKMKLENDPKMTPKWSQKSIDAGELLEPFLVSFSCFWARGPKMAPRGPSRGSKKAPDGAKRAHDGSKMAPGGPQEGPRQPKMAPKGSQDGLKWLR